MKMPTKEEVVILLSAQGKLLGSTPGMLTSICAPKQIVRL